MLVDSVARRHDPFIWGEANARKLDQLWASYQYARAYARSFASSKPHARTMAARRLVAYRRFHRQVRGQALARSLVVFPLEATTEGDEGQRLRPIR